MAGSDTLTWLFVNYQIWNSYKADFEIQYVNAAGQHFQTTYRRGGWWPIFKVDDGPETRILGTNGGVATYGDITVRTNLIHPEEFGSKKNNFLLVEWFATNNNPTEPHYFSLTSHTDVMIANNDYADVKAYADDYVNKRGFTMHDDYTSYTLTLMVRDAFKVTNVDTFWFGQWTSYIKEHKWENTTRTTALKGYDSSFSFGWWKRPIRGNQTERFAVLLGVGENLMAPPVVEVTNTFQENYNPKQKVNITGILKETDKEDIINCWYKFRNETHSIFTNLPTNDFDGVFTTDFSFGIELPQEVGAYDLEIQAKDRYNMTSNVIN